MRRYLTIVLLAVSFIATQSFAQKIAAKRDVEVSISLNNGTLYGSLLVPKGRKPKPLVLLIPGSGPTDRNCNSSIGLRSNSFLLLAEELYGKGIATLRIDKRTSGKSFETFKTSLDSLRFYDFVEDVNRWIEWLKKDPRFSHVIVAGHSKGALVGNLASIVAQPDGFISLAGAGRPIGDVLFDQIKSSLRSSGELDTLSQFIDSLEAGAYFDDAPVTLRQMFPKQLSAFMSEWMSYDPRVEIAKLNCKVAIIAGGHDLQIPIEDAERLRSSSPEALYVVFEEMNHVLKDSSMDRFENFATYNQPEKPISSRLSEAIANFVFSVMSDQ